MDNSAPFGWASCTTGRCGLGFCPDLLDGLRGGTRVGTWIPECTGVWGGGGERELTGLGRSFLGRLRDWRD